VAPEDGQVMGLEFVGLEITKGAAVTAQVLLEIQVRLQGKCLLGGKKGQ